MAKISWLQEVSVCMGIRQSFHCRHYLPCHGEAYKIQGVMRWPKRTVEIHSAHERC